MIITTTDPITGENIHNPEFKPFVIEGSGHLAIKIYFESEETRSQYLDNAGVAPTTGSRRGRQARTRGTLPGHPGMTTRLRHPLDIEDTGLTKALL